MFYIYKITNKINGKMYIGQVYNKTIYDRFKRHCKDACSTSKSYVDRAIHKYGPENFIVEQIDEATNKEELNNKEIYWIAYYNSTVTGYNLTNGGDGGNTYLRKTNEEMTEIRNKISKSNKGSKNGMSHSIKALNVITGELINFETIAEATAYFKLKNHNVFNMYCKGYMKYYYKNTWNFANINEDFKTLQFRDGYHTCGTTVSVTDLETNERKIYESIAAASKALNIPKINFNGSKSTVIDENFLVEKL